MCPCAAAEARYEGRLPVMLRQSHASAAMGHACVWVHITDQELVTPCNQADERAEDNSALTVRQQSRATLPASKRRLTLTRSLRSSPSPAACPGRRGRGRASCPGCDSGLPCPAAGRPCPPRAAAAPQRDRPDCAGVGTRGGGQHEDLFDGDLVVNVPAEACRKAEAADTSLLVRGACVGYHRTCVSDLPYTR